MSKFGIDHGNIIVIRNFHSTSIQVTEHRLKIKSQPQVQEILNIQAIYLVRKQVICPTK